MKMLKISCILFSLFFLAACKEGAKETKNSSFKMTWKEFGEQWADYGLPKIADYSTHKTTLGTRYNGHTGEFLVSAEVDRDGRMISFATVGIADEKAIVYEAAIQLVKMADETLGDYEVEKIAFDTLGLDGDIANSKQVSYTYNGLTYEAEYDDSEGHPLLKVSIQADEHFAYR